MENIRIHHECSYRIGKSYKMGRNFNQGRGFAKSLVGISTPRVNFLSNMNWFMMDYFFPTFPYI